MAWAVAVAVRLCRSYVQIFPSQKEEENKEKTLEIGGSLVGPNYFKLSCNQRMLEVQ